MKTEFSPHTYWLHDYFKGKITCESGLAELVKDEIVAACNVEKIKIRISGSNQSEAQYINFTGSDEQDFYIRIAAHESRTYNSQPDFEITLGGCNEMTSEIISCETSIEDEEFEDSYEDEDEDEEGNIIAVPYTDVQKVHYFEYNEQELAAAVVSAMAFIKRKL